MHSDLATTKYGGERKAGSNTDSAEVSLKCLQSEYALSTNHVSGMERKTKGGNRKLCRRVLVPGWSERCFCGPVGPEEEVVGSCLLGQSVTDFSWLIEGSWRACIGRDSATCP